MGAETWGRAAVKCWHFGQPRTHAIDIRNAAPLWCCWKRMKSMKEVWRRRKRIHYVGAKTENVHTSLSLSFFTNPLLQPLCPFVQRKSSTSESTKFSGEQPSSHLPPHLPSEHRNIQEAPSSKAVVGGGHQLLTDPAAVSWQLWRLHSISPFCLWHSYHYT